MERASCSERTYDYAYANPLISRSTRTGPADASLGCLGDDASANRQSPPSVEVGSPAIYIDKNYEDMNRRPDPEGYVEMGKRRGVEFADSAMNIVAMAYPKKKKALEIWFLSKLGDSDHLQFPLINITST